MNTIIIIKQIFLNTDLRLGEQGLTALLQSDDHPIRRDFLAKHEVVLFMNRQRNIIKVLGQQGMLVDRIHGRGTFDFKLRREQIFKAIGQYFGIELHVPENIFRKTIAEVEPKGR